MDAASLAERAEAPRKFGPAQGVLLAGGFFLATLVGGALTVLFWGIGIGVEAGALASNSHGKVPVHIPTPGLGLLAASVLTGYLLAAAWAIWYSFYIAKPLLKVGDAQGLGWRGADRHGYLVAAGLSLVVVAVALGLVRLVPPDIAKLTGPAEQLSRSHGWPHIVLVVLMLGVAPFVEEFAFRGTLIAAFAQRFHVVTAVLISTLLFVMMHAADKIHYWPGFIDVGLLGVACAFVRLRYRSVRPAMLLHFLYNGCLVVLPETLRWHGW